MCCVCVWCWCAPPHFWKDTGFQGSRVPEPWNLGTLEPCIDTDFQGSGVPGFRNPGTREPWNSGTLELCQVSSLFLKQTQWFTEFPGSLVPQRRGGAGGRKNTEFPGSLVPGFRNPGTLEPWNPVSIQGSRVPGFQGSGTLEPGNPVSILVSSSRLQNYRLI